MKPPLTLSDLANHLPDARVHGDSKIEVKRLVSPDGITSPGDLPLVMSKAVAESLAAAESPAQSGGGDLC